MSDTKAKLAELAARAESATSAVVRPTDAELGQARAWAERVGHRWTQKASISQEDAKTVARVLSWMLAERGVLRRVSAEAVRRYEGAPDRLGEALAALDVFDQPGAQLPLLGKDR
ncbi:MAG TPA: hypothetical protein VHM19_23175 [Polyangiales bacterium]|jgi:hypothetical protein|nr:hypothetical protein [Polyangiales bacterium]